MKKALLDAVWQAESIALLAHVSADMDTLGSCVGAKALIESCTGGKRIDVLTCEPVALSYHFLPGIKDANPPAENVRYDLAIAVDVSSPDRLGQNLRIFQQARQRFVFDHHGSNNFEDEKRIVEPFAAATAEMVLALAFEEGLTLGEKAAMCLYAGLSTDTGNFSFSSVSGRTLRMAAWCVENGAKPAFLTENLYGCHRVEHTALLGRALCSARYFSEGRIVVYTLSHQDKVDCKAEDGDFEGIVRFGIETKGVEAAAFLSEREVGHIRCSLRTKPSVDAAAVALRFGGGGHARAAGLTIDGQSLQDAAFAVRVALEQALSV